MSAIDDGQEDDLGGGTTARAYGIRGYPTFVLIDRAGKVAMCSDDPAEFLPAFAPAARQHRIDLSAESITPQQSSHLCETMLATAIKSLLELPEPPLAKNLPAP